MSAGTLHASDGSSLGFDWGFNAQAGTGENVAEKEILSMLTWAITFFLLAVLAGIFGFGGIASSFASIAQILFFVFLALLVISAVAHAVRGRPPM